jgi:nicotinamidase-related amidase
MNYRIFLIFVLFIAASLNSCKEKDDEMEVNDQTEKLILRFKIQEISYTVYPDQDNKTIEFKVAARVDLSEITPKIMISPGASISPPSGQTIDLTQPVTYTVTAGDGTSQNYTVSATMATDTALVVIDMQNGAFNIPEFLIYNAEGITEAVKLMVAKTRGAGKRVVYSMATSDGVPEGSWDWQLVPGLSFETNDLVVLKNASDAFEDSELHEDIMGIDAGTIIMCGVATNMCMNNSFNGADVLGYDIIMVADGHSTSGDQAEQTIASFNSTWANKGAAVLPCDQINF